jgi:hypothetical protein
MKTDDTVPKRSTSRNAKAYLKLIGPGTIITVLGFIVAYQFVAPAPPRHITLATGWPDGAYFKFGNAYSALLKKYGIRLEVIPTAGSAENLQSFNAGNSGVDVAFLQSGMQSSGRSDDLLIRKNSIPAFFTQWCRLFIYSGNPLIN